MRLVANVGQNGRPVAALAPVRCLLRATLKAMEAVEAASWLLPAKLAD
jgi:hypothetical protein